jgi:hypothetical protein
MHGRDGSKKTIQEVPAVPLLNKHLAGARFEEVFVA